MISLKHLALTAALCAAAAPAAQGQAQAQGRGPDLQALHDDLHLTPTQEPAWRTFAAASAPDPEQQARERAAQAMLPTLRAPQRVDLGIAAMEADLATLRQRGAALKAFYATLTAVQQATFDRETLAGAESGE